MKLGIASVVSIVLTQSCFEQPAQIAAAAGYEAQQMRCIEQYNDKESIDKCRDKVKLAWTVDASVDASKEAGDASK